MQGWTSRAARLWAGLRYILEWWRELSLNHRHRRQAALLARAKEGAICNWHRRDVSIWRLQPLSVPV